MQMNMSAETITPDQSFSSMSSYPPSTSRVFVFGSNLAGIHGAGAAKFARLNYDAQWGVGHGPTGTSYALPTKDKRVISLSLEDVHRYVDTFIEHARLHPDITFDVTCVGCGLAGFSHEEIAPMFINAPSNCRFSSVWERWLPGRQYWTDL